MATKDLSKAKTSKKDEFYTQLTDIEKELKNYKEHFENKVVLCNCDDPRVSNFTKYFITHFRLLKLKKLICTCYKNNNTDLFSTYQNNQAVYFIYTNENEVINNIDDIQLNIKPLKGDGDFRSQECIELLKEADIVCSNPPFSLFREYLSQLITYDKKFLIIGNVNSITYKDTFKLISENKIWLGKSIHSGDREFGVPKDYPLKAASSRIDEKGNKFIRVKGIRWFTNLDYKERHEDLILYKKYTAEEYPVYDNYNAININKTSDIPCDYEGIMGVPITFLDKYNPEQFEIIGNEDSLNIPRGRGYIKGVRKYGRIFIQKKK